MNDEWFTRIQDGYQQDQRLSRIITALRLETPEAEAAARTHLSTDMLDDLSNGRFFMLDNLLYRRENPSTSVVVLGDTDTKREVLTACHDDIVSGHFSTERTLDRIRKYAWWPGMAKDVKDYCETCKVRQSSKRGTGRQTGLMMKIDTPTRPWETNYTHGFRHSAASGWPRELERVLSRG